MGDFFCDTSAIVKRYVEETGSQFVDDLLDADNRNVIFLASITLVEVAGAIARRVKGGHTTSVEAENALKAFQYESINIFYQVEVSPRVLDLALSLASKHALRGYDAVQLAAALDANAELLAARLPAITLVSADGELNNAAIAEGLKVENPNDYP